MLPELKGNMMMERAAHKAMDMYPEARQFSVVIEKANVVTGSGAKNEYSAIIRAYAIRNDGK